MAKYSKGATKAVKSALHRKKKGTLRSGKGGKGGKVTSREQAIAIGLSEAREKGAKVPEKKSSSGRTTQRKSATKKKGTTTKRKSATKKVATRRKKSTKR